MGPPWEKRQNAYLLQEACQGLGRGVSLFYEPHCDFTSESLREHVPAHVDVVVTPIVNQNLIVYPLVRPQCCAKCPFTCQFDWLSYQLCRSLDRLSDSARSPVNLIGSPINYANPLIGSPIVPVHLSI